MISSILFRVDGGNIYSVAMGHVYRCVRLAKYLSENAVGCLFLMKNYPEGVQAVVEAGFPVERMDAAITEKEEAILSVGRAAENSSPLFIDLRTPKGHIVEAANPRNVATIVYEDVSIEPLEPTMLINPSMAAHLEQKYNAGRTKYLLGTEYLILDPLVEKCRRTKFIREVKELFMSFGGADPCNLSSRIAGILLSGNDDYRINIAIGPAFKHQAQLDEIIRSKDSKKRIRIVKGSNELPALIARADAAITAGGTIAYEAIGVCVPVLILPSIFSEAQIASSLNQKGLAGGFDKDVAEITDAELRAAVDEFIRNKDKREAIYIAQSQFKLSGGIDTVAKHLLAVAY
jgi:spore coat polysaccharide biosynthesis predicted glycosyltransferase SpsG